MRESIVFAMKYFLWGLLYAVLVVNGEQPKPHSREQKQKPNSATQQTDNPATQTVVVVDQQTPRGQEEKHSTNPPSYLSRLFSPENLPNVALAFVAAITAYFIAVQARETRRATEAMQRSTRLQEIGLRQWVDVHNWKIATKYFHHVMTRYGKVMEKPPAIEMQITFDVINSSPRPLTVQKVSADVHVAGRKDWEGIATSNKLGVPPEGDYPVSLSVTLTGDEVDRYILDKLLISISGRVFYEDGIGKNNEQPFSQYADCGISGARFYSSKNTPTEQD